MQEEKEAATYIQTNTTKTSTTDQNRGNDPPNLITSDCRKMNTEGTVVSSPDLQKR